MRLFQTVIAAMAATLFLYGCGNSQNSGASSFNSAGQVASTGSTQVSYYAAARFAEQVSFGPTPELIAEIQSKGYSKWIDDQMALPASQIDLSPKMPDLLKGNDDRPSQDWAEAQFPNVVLSAPDQLRVRVAWSLSQFVVVSRAKVQPITLLEWQNWLLRNAFTRYEDFLYELTVQPGMGYFLDNEINRPKSANCDSCAPNENYARELMQLFSIGVYKLNPDGTTVMGGDGLPVETYKQDDVEDMARALTGWAPQRRARTFEVMNNADGVYWGKPMEPINQNWAHDFGEKRVLGSVIPAGQDVGQDLRSVVRILMSHPNTAPFVSFRLIQNLVKSNPSPEYVARVAAVWQNNGSGVKGDLKAVVKAVLLDPEARRSDDFRAQFVTDGKLRESFLFEASLWRALSCSRWPARENGQPNLKLSQYPFGSDTVFGYYAPTDVAAGTSIPAPEQKLFDANEFQGRLDFSIWMQFGAVTRQDEVSGVNSMRAAGCQFDELYAAYQKSPAAIIDLLGQKFFKGVMPAVLRAELERLYQDMKGRTWQKEQEKPLSLMHYALASPYYGAMK